MKISKSACRRTVFAERVFSLKMRVTGEELLFLKDAVRKAEPSPVATGVHGQLDEMITQLQK